MILAPEALEELQQLCADATVMAEGDLTYVHLPGLQIPHGQRGEALLCLSGRDGYPTRLFLSSPVPGRGNNWSTHRIFDKAWHTWSWNYVPADLRPIEILLAHLGALR